MDDVTKAFEQKETSSETTTTQQVGSIKSIQVQSKKTGVRITTHSTKINGHSTTTSTSHENEVNTLLNEAQQMVAVGDETYEIPSTFTGNSDDVFVASLTRRDGSGLGLGLIDGMVSGGKFLLKEFIMTTENWFDMNNNFSLFVETFQSNLLKYLIFDRSTF